MSDFLMQHISERVTLNKGEKELILSLIQTRKLRRRQVLLQQGEAFPYLAFVEKGILRSYLTDDRHKEHIFQFAPEGSWCPDNFNFENKIFEFTIDAIEPSEVILIDKNVYHQLLLQVPKMERYFRMVMQDRLEALQTRVFNYLSHQADEKFRVFVEVYPEIVRRVPQHMIASYLGIKPETLSRNRKQAEDLLK